MPVSKRLAFAGVVVGVYFGVLGLNTGLVVILTIISALTGYVIVISHLL